MKCLILAAGYATRLYPLTENFPKPLLDVGGKTILDWLVDDIDTSGMVDEYVVISNHKFVEHFKRWANAKTCNITVVDDGTSTNETRLGAVKDIKFAIDSLNISDDVLVIAGDNLLDFSLTAFIEYADKAGSSCVMRYYEPDSNKLRKSGVLKIAEDDSVLAMTEKPENPDSHWCCPPFYFYKAADISLIGEALDDGCGFDAPGSYVAWLCERAKIHAMKMPGGRYDIGNIESYEKAKEAFQGI